MYFIRIHMFFAHLIVRHETRITDAATPTFFSLHTLLLLLDAYSRLREFTATARTESVKLTRNSTRRICRQHNRSDCQRCPGSSAPGRAQTSVSWARQRFRCIMRKLRAYLTFEFGNERTSEYTYTRVYTCELDISNNRCEIKYYNIVYTMQIRYYRRLTILALTHTDIEHTL